MATEGTSADPTEIARFGRLAAEWWDPGGPMRPLHRMNELRVGWITDRIRQHFGPAASPEILDAGCGAGIAAEAMARRGFPVLGLDPSPRLIKIAETHRERESLALRYRIGLPEQLLEEGARFHVVTALEVIEHVARPAPFVTALAALLHPGGLLFVSTINRTLKSMLVAKLGAEYLLRLLPPGTHQWQRFIRPAEMERLLRGAKLRLADIAGMEFDPLRTRWRVTGDLSVNYILLAEA